VPESAFDHKSVWACNVEPNNKAKSRVRIGVIMKSNLKTEENNVENNEDENNYNAVGLIKKLRLRRFFLIKNTGG